MNSDARRRVAGSRLLPAAALVTVIFWQTALRADDDQLAPFSAMPPGNVTPPWLVQNIRGREPAVFRVTADGVLAASAEAAVGSLYHPLDPPHAASAVLSWRWRLADLVEQSTLNERAGDDFPARVYVLFDYDVGRLPFLARWQLRLARLIYGDWVPAAALCYVPVNGFATGTIVANAYSDRIRMVVVSAAAETGKWRTFTRDVEADFTAAFGEPPPPISGIAVAIDTDDTGGAARAEFGDLTLRPAQ